MLTSRRHVRPVFALVLAAFLLSAPAWAQEKKHPASKAQTQKQLSDVRSKVQVLTKQQAETAQKREKINGELAQRSKALASAASALRETEAALAAKQKDLEQLQEQQRALQHTLDGQREAIAELLRATYALGGSSDMRLLLGDDDVAQIARALAYSKYFQQDQLRRVRLLMSDLARLQQLQASITAEQQALEEKRAQRAAQAKALTAQRAEQQKLARAVDATYQNEAQRLAALKRDEASLNALAAKLQKAIDDAAREARRRQQESGKSSSGSGKALADIRSNLPWPASGSVHNYGNGVLIKADGGSEVHAVARGRVIFANFLRGYGMLIILDHGNGWMSMYGNNESLLHKVGDTVDAGQAIGTAVSPTSTNTGAYFELRHNNKPVDPKSWLARHR